MHNSILKKQKLQFSSESQQVSFVTSNSLQPHGLQCARLPCPSLSPRVHSDSCSLSWWCYPTISSSVVPFSSCPQSFPAWVGSSHQVAKVLQLQLHHLSFQGWFPLALTDLISLSKGLSRVFFSTTVLKHQFFGPQPSLWSKSHICTWLLEKP